MGADGWSQQSVARQCIPPAASSQGVLNKPIDGRCPSGNIPPFCLKCKENGFQINWIGSQAGSVIPSCRAGSYLGPATSAILAKHESKVPVAVVNCGDFLQEASGSSKLLEKFKNEIVFVTPKEDWRLLYACNSYCYCYSSLLMASEYKQIFFKGK